VHISPLRKTIDQSLGEYYAEHDALVSGTDRFYMSVADGVECLSYGAYAYEPQEAYIELAVGGHTVTVKPERPRGMGGEGVGGARGRVTEYSRQSRNRLLRLIGRTDKFNQPVFLTLTYPDVYSQDKDKWKRDIDVFGKRLVRKYDGASFIWRIEFKERLSGKNQGVIMPHFHLLVWGVSASDLRTWVSRSWYEVCGSGDAKHLRAGTSTERLKSWNGVISYVSKYIAKLDKFPQNWTGRVWGIVGRSSIPWAVIVYIPLDNDTAIRLTRLGRKMCKLGGKTLVYGLTWLMNTERVLDYLEWVLGFT
jgi:hypothetical protein